MREMQQARKEKEAASDHAKKSTAQKKDALPQLQNRDDFVGGGPSLGVPVEMYQPVVGHDQLADTKNEEREGPGDLQHHLRVGAVKSPKMVLTPLTGQVSKPSH